MPDTKQFSADAADLHRQALVVDGLNATWLDEVRVDLLKQGGVDCAVKGAGDVAEHARLLSFIDDHSQDVTRATTVKEIRQAKQDGKIAIIFEWQSADPLIGDGDPAVTLRAYHELGLRIVGIAYNTVNVFGGGSLEPRFGLTRLGARLVEGIHKNNILLDVGGHTAEQAAFDALEISKGRAVVCTHTNIRTLNNNPRCMSDKLIEAIADTGGMIGITAFSDFMARNPSNNHLDRTPQVGLDTYLDQIDYVRRLVGADHVGVAADNVEAEDIAIPISDNLSPEAYSRTPWFYAKGFESIAEYPNVTKGLLDRGWSPADVCKVIGENWLRVYEKAWGD